MSEAETNNECTILDYLNEDCWRAVLRYVPVEDIVQSERVSRRWQGLVLAYLQGIRFSFWGRTNENYPSNAFYWKLSISMYESFAKWTSKLGSTVVAITIHCSFNQENLKIIRKNCPNLEALGLINFEELKSKRKKGKSTQNFNKHFKGLKRLSFSSCIISDQCIGQYIEDRALEELEFCLCFKFTGEFLNTVNLSNMKSLVFMSCPDLQDSHILTSINQLCELTKLVLNGVPKKILKKIQYVLDKMPKLEQLELFTDQGFSNECCLQTYEPLCKLDHLKHLKMDLKVGDDSVEAITRCCKELQILHLGDCECLNSDGLEAISRNAGERLTELGLLSFGYLEDEDVVNCVRSCPKLTKLFIGEDCRITGDLPALVLAARHDVSPGHVLTLDVSGTMLKFLNDTYESDSDEEDDELEEKHDIRRWGDLIVIYS